MHRKSRVTSAIKYDCFKWYDSASCIIRKTDNSNRLGYGMYHFLRVPF